MLLFAIKSSKPKVKQAALEALAIVQQTLPPSVFDPLLASQDQDTIRVLQRRYRRAKFANLVYLFFFSCRFSRGQLPILGVDGSVEFRIGIDGSVMEDFYDPSVSLTFNASHIQFVIDDSRYIIHRHLPLHLHEYLHPLRKSP